MAAKNSMIKFAIFFLVLLTTTTVDKCGTWKFQVMALRDLPYEATLLQNKLLLNNILGSCDSYCSSNSDCGGFTLCQWCWEKTNPFTGAIYSTCSILP
ncbi:Fruit-specific protein [Capsicum chinense]|nr:Fruit-specific protein [Capsicum chinense]